jgi:hypothetical protein
MYDLMHIPFEEQFSIHDTEDVLNRSGKNFLSIELSPGGFSYCILDTERFKYTLLESFTFGPGKDFDYLNKTLEHFAKKRKFLTAFYQRISFAYVGPKSVLVPAELFSYLDKNRFLDFNIYPDDEYDVKVDRLNNLAAYSVYPFPKPLQSKINQLFPGCRIRHHSSCLIENTLYMIRYGAVEAQLVLHIQKGHFEVLLFKDKNLSFYNSFNYLTWDDLFYYLFFVLEQLQLDAKKLDTMILGEVSIGSEFYKKMRLYMKSITFGPRSELFKYCDRFDELPHHYYFNLLNLNSCG